MTVRVHRYEHAGLLNQGVAVRLAHRLQNPGLQLCLSDGLTEVCAALETHVTEDHAMERTGLWWSEETFVDVTDPLRVSTRTLAALGGVRLRPENVHPMPTTAGSTDPDAAALSYAAELSQVTLDVAILCVGADGGVAGLRPDCTAFTTPPGHTVVGVRCHGVDRLTLTIDALAQAGDVWLLAVGPDVAPILERVIAGDETLPAGAVRGRHNTELFVDESAGAQLPWHVCDL